MRSCLKIAALACALTAAAGGAMAQRNSAEATGWSSSLSDANNLLAKTDAHAFALIDVDEAEDLAAKYNVTSVPHFVFLKGGAPADAYVGSSAEELQAKLAVCFL